MPELPEVETVVRTLAPHVLGRTVRSFVVVRRPCLVAESRPASAAEGLRIEEVFRRGKFVVCRLARPDDGSEKGDFFWVTHLRMTGSLVAREGEELGGEKAEPGKHTRALVDLVDAEKDANTVVCRVLFNDPRTFGRIFLGSGEALEAWSSWARLGPEPLTMGPDAFVAAVRGARPVKAVLLDQTRLAGVGNIYADESLHAAGLSPMKKADDLTDAEKRRLYAKLVEVLETSIRECGSSIRDYRDADGNVGAFQNLFRVYGRGGLPCLTCGRTLRRTTVAGRGTVYCPHCQKKGRG